MAAALLGVVDASVGDDDVLDYTVTKLGGSPNWQLPREGPTAVCGNCGAGLPLVLQVYCPLEGSPYHRTLYILGCTNRPCWNKDESWTVIRQQTLSQDVTTARTHPATGGATSTEGASGDSWGVDADDWGVDASDWNDDGESWGEEPVTEAVTTPATPDTPDSDIKEESRLSASNLSPNPTESLDPLDQLQTMCIDDVEEDTTSGVEPVSHCVAEDLPLSSNIMEVLDIKTTTSETDQTMCTAQDSKASSMASLKSFYVNVIEEPAGDDDLCHERALLSEYSRREGVDLDSLLTSQGDHGGKSKGKGGSSEGYEKAAARHRDQNFYKFNKRVSRFPQQIIRYSHQGSPLLLAASHGPIPPCLNCGAQRQYELQLMPALVSQLLTEGATEPAVEFGTVLVYTCRGSCWQEGDTWRKECALVQPDPDQDLFRK